MVVGGEPNPAVLEREGEIKILNEESIARVFSEGNLFAMDV